MKHLRKPVVTTPSRPATPRQLVIAFESPRLRTMNVRSDRGSPDAGGGRRDRGGQR